jgi:hypothetical protein
MPATHRSAADSSDCHPHQSPSRRSARAAANGLSASAPEGLEPGFAIRAGHRGADHPSSRAPPRVERQHRGFEIGKSLMISIVRHVLVHQVPELLDRIQMWQQGWAKNPGWDYKLRLRRVIDATCPTNAGPAIQPRRLVRALLERASSSAHQRSATAAAATSSHHDHRSAEMYRKNATMLRLCLLPDVAERVSFNR